MRFVTRWLALPCLSPKTDRVKKKDPLIPHANPKYYRVTEYVRRTAHAQLSSSDVRTLSSFSCIYTVSIHYAVRPEIHDMCVCQDDDDDDYLFGVMVYCSEHF